MSAKEFSTILNKLNKVSKKYDEKDQFANNELIPSPECPIHLLWNQFVESYLKPLMGNELTYCLDCPRGRLSSAVIADHIYNHMKEEEFNIKRRGHCSGCTVGQNKIDNLNLLKRNNALKKRKSEVKSEKISKVKSKSVRCSSRTRSKPKRFDDDDDDNDLLL